MKNTKQRNKRFRGVNNKEEEEDKEREREMEHKLQVVIKGWRIKRLFDLPGSSVTIQ